MWISISIALAQPTDAIRQQVDQLYGKPVPAEAVCVAHPELPAPFVAGVTPVGVRRGVRGCVLIGVMVADQWHDVGAALGPAVDRAAWNALDAGTREARWLDWVDGVLLAFAQPDVGGLAQVTVDPKKKVTIVDRRFLRRDDEPGRSADVVGKWTFDAELTVTDSTEQVIERQDVSLFQRPDKIEGISEAAVDEAIRSKGLVIRKCFTQAWEADLALAGRVKLEWTLAGGKVGEVAVIAEPNARQPASPAMSGTDDKLARCYAGAIRSATYPPGANGMVRWVFGVERDTVK